MAVTEPWLRGTLTDLPVVPRAALHALQQAHEELRQWCEALTEEEVNSRPLGLASISFQLRHVAGSVDRLLTYAEGRELSPEQIAALQQEQAPGSQSELLANFESVLVRADQRIRALADVALESPRFVGKKRISTTLGSLLIHIADHTQRHVGHVITTSKVLVALRDAKPEIPA
jgi:uncharacterized damage-inducible protein DinB